MSGTIRRQAIEVFPALEKNFGRHKFKDESEAENSCSTVVVHTMEFSINREQKSSSQGIMHT
jgi:hypothetical protein